VHGSQFCNEVIMLQQKLSAQVDRDECLDELFKALKRYRSYLASLKNSNSLPKLDEKSPYQIDAHTRDEEFSNSMAIIGTRAQTSWN
jgi:hypothetical protein